jgi:DNA-binding NtrC family response regulator
MEKILIIDDDRDFQFTISHVLKEEKYEVSATCYGKAALKAVKRDSPHLILLDIRLPDMNGMKVLEEIKKIDQNLGVVMITGFGEVNGAVKAMKLGALDYITKPFDNRELIFRVKKALEIQYLSREVEGLRKKLGEKIPVEEMMGESPTIRRILKQVEIVAPTDLTVILQGESGTGKELIAQMIHQESKRKNKPFIAIDCGAIPEALAESELFGYEKGAFTGSDEKKEGRFEQANEGALFLDEISNLSDAIQMKLLRVIQERKLQHLGGKKDIKIDVRIIVATNRDLCQEVRSGNFRNDLFQRLNEFLILLPALRQRKEDIPTLARYFLKEANHELRKNIRRFSPEAMKFLLDYHWPGNVREMKNLIRKAALLADSEEIAISHLSSMTMKPQDEMDLPKIFNNNEELSFEEITRNFEKDLIRMALEKTGYNKTRAAKILKLHRKVLYRKMKSLGLPLHLN